MNFTQQLLLVAAIAFVVALLAPFVLLPILRYFRVIDIPNERSSHKETTIRGAGIATLAGFLAGAVALLTTAQQHDSIGLIAFTALIVLAISLLGAIEDWRGLPIMVRAGLQFVLGCGLGAILVIGTGLPWLFVPVIAFFFTAYVNIANFMDGVDGISGLHGLVVGAAYAVLAAQLQLNWLTAMSLVVAVAFAAFLPWNLGRGRVFMGDAGSYLLGGSIATLAAVLFATGAPLVAVIAPLSIYFADTGLTLMRRILRGEKWYESHRAHVYQRLTDVGLGHAQVAFTVAGFTIVAAVFGILAATFEPAWPIWVTTALLVATAVFYLVFPKLLQSTRMERHKSAQSVQNKGGN